MPGLVRGEFDEDVAAKKYHSELIQVMSSNPDAVPYHWLQQQFSDMNIDSYLHNFTLQYPLAHNVASFHFFKEQINNTFLNGQLMFFFDLYRNIAAKIYMRF